jgi:hypothetical protein
MDIVHLAAVCHLAPLASTTSSIPNLQIVNLDEFITIDTTWQQYDWFYLSALEGRNQDLKGVSPSGTPCWLPSGIRAITARRRRRRSKFPNQEIPQEHWELGEHNWKHMRTDWEHDGNKSIKKFHPQLTRRPPLRVKAFHPSP